MHKIFNGKSIFGIDNNYVHVGAIVLDDSHACVDVIKEAFTITISKMITKIYIKNHFSI